MATAACRGKIELPPVIWLKVWIENGAVPSDAGSIDYGQEWDASLGYAFDKHWSGLLKLADYNADEIGTDTAKLWLSMEYVY